MGRQSGFFDVEERLREISAKGDDLERLSALVEFEAFRPELERAVPRSDRAKGGRPPYDHVLMFKVLIRTSTATDAARHGGAQLPDLLDKTNTGSRVWADTA